MGLELAGKAFIVTGGTDGLGLATACTLLEEGADVLISGRSEAKFAGLRASLDRAGRRMGKPAELGRMATVLLSPVSSHITGVALPIDGGQLRSP